MNRKVAKFKSGWSLHKMSTPINPDTPKDIPMLVSIILCDQIIEDKITNNKSLIGIFNTLLTRNVPAHHPYFCILGSFSGVKGQYEAMVRITRPSGTPVMELKGEANFIDHANVFDMVFTIKGFPIEEFGVYSVDFFFDESPVASRTFTVQKSK